MKNEEKLSLGECVQEREMESETKNVTNVVTIKNSCEGQKLNAKIVQKYFLKTETIIAWIRTIQMTFLMGPAAIYTALTCDAI